MTFHKFIKFTWIGIGTGMILLLCIFAYQYLITTPEPTWQSPQLNPQPGLSDQPATEDRDDTTLETRSEKNNPGKLSNDSSANHGIDARIESQLAIIRGEPLEQSIRNLNDIDMYYYPGFTVVEPAIAIIFPPLQDLGRDYIERVISNRRFLRVYQDLQAMSKDEASRYLAAALDHQIEEYKLVFREQVSGIDIIDVSRSYGPDTFARWPAKEGANKIGSNAGGTPTLCGAQHGMVALLMLAGNLGSEALRHQVKEAVRVAEVQRDLLYAHEEWGLSPDRAIHALLRYSIYNRQALAMAMLGTSPEEDVTLQSHPRAIGALLPSFDVRRTPYDLEYSKAEDQQYLTHGISAIVEIDEAAYLAIRNEYLD